MSQHFKDRGYPDDIIKKGRKKAEETPRLATLDYRPKPTLNRVPVVVTHHPSNPPLRQWLTQHLPILHSSSKMRSAVPTAPVVGERNCRSLKNILMPSSLPSPSQSTGSPPGCFKCSKPRCVMCKEHLVEGSHFQDSSQRETFTIRSHYTCDTTNIVYLLWCQKCNHSQYVGETKNSLRARFYQHRSDIHLKKGKCTHVVEHFNRENHSLQDLRCLVIERVYTESCLARNKREDFWRKKLQTVYPKGLNTLDD